MSSIRALSLLLLLCAPLSRAAPAVTVYDIWGAQAEAELGQGPLATPEEAAFLAQYGAYNSVQLKVPPAAVPAPATSFALALHAAAGSVPGIGPATRGDLLGFSVEMSVVGSVVGRNSSLLQVPFLNLLASVANRGGGVRVRLGGNTQEYATLVDALPPTTAVGSVTAKGPVVFPAGPQTVESKELLYTTEMLKMLQAVSTLTGAKWFLGIPFNDTANPRLQIAEQADAILGNNVVGYQVGNEPDLFAGHGRRPATWTIQNYLTEFKTITDMIRANPKITSKGNIVGPSIQGSKHGFGIADVLAAGYVQAFADDLSIVSIEHYAQSNCAAVFPNGGFGPMLDPQTILPLISGHGAAQGVLAPFLPGVAAARAAGKQFMMFETNTASCGGFGGVSGAHLHMGGQNASYNVRTVPALSSCAEADRAARRTAVHPPPTNMSSFKQWTVGAPMYATLFSAEALGPTGSAQVVDLAANLASNSTPAYAIYENGAAARVALFNYQDASNGAAYTATISVGGATLGESNATPSSVRVKYLVAPSITEKEQISWANQTFGGRFSSDGRLAGTEDIVTVPCDTTAHTCTITVPAPGAALVFLSSADSAGASATQTFATSVTTKVFATASIDPTSLAHSNGQRPTELLGTSQGGANTEEGVAAAFWEGVMWLFLRAGLTCRDC
ncbi:uncharacterized protein BXZ73DRAFT_81750 [Epithele typhae]|uniref:uncharacterized protein n=1 Tax=Epithele typhae TaxID=378194 RepID=UPI0020080919|nr:uncharacterized protein BXZ73DRAFT_81750 [Epithele typhae]KAH9914074.1 hypothetical protein BXZ73DRAFT_81750 [Epithele typhae]